MNNFEKWDKAFRARNLYAFNNDANALLWLKVRAVSRGKQMKQFLNDNGLTLTSTKITEQNVELFELMEQRQDAKSMLDNYLQSKNHEWYTSMGIDEEKLKADLIESLFKRHPKVVSAAGEIKSVDFFIDDFPVDLKVTFFPNQYMDEKIKLKLGKSVLSWLKTKGREFGIVSSTGDSESQQIYTLTEKFREQGHDNIINSLNNVKSEVIKDAQNNPVELMTWLYAHQGEMRFGAENRLFLILADSTDMSQSWKMKRAFSLIEPEVQHYLDRFTKQSLKKIDFTFKKQNYSSLADVIFVVKK